MLGDPAGARGLLLARRRQRHVGIPDLDRDHVEPVALGRVAATFATLSPWRDSQSSFTAINCLRISRRVSLLRIASYPFSRTCALHS